MKALLRRLAWSAGVVWTVVSLAFAVEVLLPGDPARMVAGPQARPADVARIREQLGLGRPPIVRYARFWRRLVHVGPRSLDERAPEPAAGGGGAHATCLVVLPLGTTAALHVDLGKSFQRRQSVARLVATRAPRTFALALAAMLVQLAMGLGLGTAAASAPRGSWIDRAVVWATALGVSVPTFVTALSLQYLLAHRWRWLPLDGFGATPGEHARCLVLPALTLGLYGAPYYARLVRDEMIGLLRQDWVRTARAKGMPAGRVVVRHALRNALVPVAAAAALDFGALMGGAVVTETVFRWPGLGELSLRATLDRDGPVLVACVVVTSIAIVASNLAVDLGCARLDPRLRAAPDRPRS